MSEPKIPCEVCGETEPKLTLGERLAPATCYAGHWSVCPACGNYVIYLNCASYDFKTKTSKVWGAPQWVYDLSNSKISEYNLPDEPLVILNKEDL